MTQLDLLKPPYFFSVVYYNGSKSVVRNFAQYSQMVLEATDLMKNDDDVYKICLCEFSEKDVPKLIRWVSR